MYCINEHFLEGCNFDRVFRNPCSEDQQHSEEEEEERSGKLVGGARGEFGGRQSNRTSGSESSETGKQQQWADFNADQQNKLRSIASRTGLLDLLVRNSLLSKGAARAIEPLVELTPADMPTPQEKIVVYLLVAMIALTGLLTVVMVVLVINWTRFRLSAGCDGAAAAAAAAEEGPAQRRQEGRQVESRRRSHYLSNQQQQQQQPEPQLQPGARRHQHHAQAHKAEQVGQARRMVGRQLGAVVVQPTKGRRLAESVDHSAL